ncbi:MAG: hypothetical protein ACOC6D_01315, partial [Atribacterota bacterium]
SVQYNRKYLGDYLLLILPSPLGGCLIISFSLSSRWERVRVRGIIHPHLTPPPSRGRKQSEK